MLTIKKALWSTSTLSKSVLGLLAGLTVWIVLACFQRPDGYSPWISLIVVGLVSQSVDRKYLTLSGVIIGFVAGLVIGFQAALQNTPVNIVTLIVDGLLIEGSMTIWGLQMALVGLCFASVVQLYKRGSIF